MVKFFSRDKWIKEGQVWGLITGLCSLFFFFIGANGLGFFYSIVFLSIVISLSLRKEANRIIKKLKVLKYGK